MKCSPNSTSAKPTARCADLNRWGRAALALALVAVFLWMVFRFWTPLFGLTELLQFDSHWENRSVPATRGQPIVYNESGYDGQFYAQVATDPWLKGDHLKEALDAPQYRARRILMPVVAWALAGTDGPLAVRIVPWINVGCWLVLAVVLWRLFGVGRSWRALVAWGGVMFSAGALQSVRLSLPDLPALLLIVLAMNALESRRPGRMTCWYAAAFLTRETSLAAVGGFLAPPRAGLRQHLREAKWVGLGLIPLSVWIGYVFAQWGGGDAGGGGFSIPFVGLVQRWIDSVRLLAGANHLNYRIIITFLATGAITAQLAYVVVYREVGNRWWRLAAGQAVLLVLLSQAVWEGSPGAHCRVLLPMLLACNLLALTRRSSMAWLLGMNLSVFAGVWTMHRNTETVEVALQREDGAAVSLRTGRKCFSVEHTPYYRGFRIQSGAQFEARLWHATAGACFDISADVRMPQESTLLIQIDGNPLWTGVVGPQWSPIKITDIPIGVSSGRVVFDIVISPKQMHIFAICR
jgi:hypothetical protein